MSYDVYVVHELHDYIPFMSYHEFVHALYYKNS